MRTELVHAGARWLKFNLVGALGIGVQLGVLVLLTRAWHFGYILATALAVEAAVVHNFVWHERFTWVDRNSRRLAETFRRFLWFDATTGVLSIGGNVLLMRWLIGHFHIRPVHANLLSISGCSVANFLVSDKYVFRKACRRSLQIASWQRILLLVCFLMASALGARAQDAASPKFTLFGGAGTASARGTSLGEIQVGASFDEAPPGAWGGFSFEGGYLGPCSELSSGSAFFSADYMSAWSFGQKGAGHLASGARYWADRSWKFIPFASAGYTQLFGTGNAVNFGGGIDYRLSNTHAIRTEIRDYYSFSAPAGHNIALRIGLGSTFLTKLETLLNPWIVSRSRLTPSPSM